MGDGWEGGVGVDIVYSRRHKKVTFSFRPVQTEPKRAFPMPKNGNRTSGGDATESAVDYSNRS